jgi:hypothetical protein
MDSERHRAFLRVGHAYILLSASVIWGLQRVNLRMSIIII